MTKPIKINNTLLGSGIPKIAVSITGKDKLQIISQVNQIMKLAPDVVEWRIDYLSCIPNYEYLHSILSKIRQLTKSIPLICTFRSIAEGGNYHLSEQQYLKLLSKLSQDNSLDILDIEINHDTKLISKVIQQLHANQKLALGSLHDFRITPDNDFILNKIANMQAVSADIFKLAFMPTNSQDVLRLMTITRNIADSYDEPIITMSMGALGKTSRISGNTSGSVLTFGSLSQHNESAPGQICVKNLKNILKTIQ
ncbi:3-dehydroquinate dehydratase [Apilactobacillus ozensis DSM 23829 = JCM 17196]|uniref:3-dehydroquinate dehydratase n=1 Tax=Apilactobacillus ozensis DSM 23829 = JCM 17196 TaxID=1423781 RepID=A0A0R2ALN2_9LACO|nr:type I 3-dehydroquinate dehydratase [Apilactobacillus ozensis]KRM67599.1 3-dehydroquinate dehydratase [Apilactobacillus ozensis DSM 23829 = JCM 17196]